MPARNWVRGLLGHARAIEAGTAFVDARGAMFLPGTAGGDGEAQSLLQLSTRVGTFAILAVMIRMGALKRPGLILGSFIAVYAFARIIAEFFREPDPQLGFLWGGMTMGMLLSIPMIIAGAVLIVVAWRRPPIDAALKSNRATNSNRATL